MLANNCLDNAQTTENEEKKTTSEVAKSIQLSVSYHYMKYEFSGARHFYQFLDDTKAFGLVEVEEDEVLNQNKGENTQKAPQEGLQVQSNETSKPSQHYGLIVTHYDDLVQNAKYERVDYYYLDRWVVKSNDITDNNKLDLRYSIKMKGVISKPTETSKTIGLRYAKGQWLQVVFRYPWEFSAFIKKFCKKKN
ncbi:hypothetical protein RFI_31274 [Reticulomyxa filosa]|uniref:Uncharacterized protein n=1 Tax=Reticulomyxa filosa TaxID=46433 RepID=X6LY84_RETFI|nr:hypothetical protein RFI_31274 [Reticulomyxa filosa]|eukprot:ETO06122.1 hypothetical protein RFI_31274 [Reticulomyxa filosa]